jgi:hypothetical protein
MTRTMKNQVTVKQSSRTLTPKGAKSEIIKVKHGRVSKPKHVCLSDVINFIDMPTGAKRKSLILFYWRARYENTEK